MLIVPKVLDIVWSISYHLIMPGVEGGREGGLREEGLREGGLREGGLREEVLRERETVRL